MTRPPETRNYAFAIMKIYLFKYEKKAEELRGGSDHLGIIGNALGRVVTVGPTHATRLPVR